MLVKRRKEREVALLLGETGSSGAFQDTVSVLSFAIGMSGQRIELSKLLSSVTLPIVWSWSAVCADIIVI